MVEAALLADDGKHHRRIDPPGRRRDRNGPAGFRQRDPTEAGPPRDGHGRFGHAKRGREPGAQHQGHGVGGDVGRAEQEGTRSARLTPGHQEQSRPHEFATRNLPCVVRRVCRVMQLGDVVRRILPQLVFGDLAIEGGRKGCRGREGRVRILPRVLLRPSEPVPGSGTGDRRVRHLGKLAEAGLGAGRVMQPAQCDKSGEKRRIGQIGTGGAGQ